jgi:predicted O-methyltransferase YrrM
MVKDIDISIRKELLWVNSHMDEIRTHLTKCSAGSLYDIDNVAESYYYRYLSAAMRALKPKQVVELGSAGGASTLMMMATLPKDSQLIACSIPEPEIEFRFIDETKYPNLTCIHGNDLDLDVWKGVDLHETDFWFIDTEHSYEQLHKELELYDRFFKPGAVILLDDIRINEGMQRAWDEITYPKLSLPDLHHSGYGLICV